MGTLCSRSCSNPTPWFKCSDNNKNNNDLENIHSTSVGFNDVVVCVTMEIPLSPQYIQLSGATAFGGKWKSFHAATFVYQKPPACLQLHNSMSTFEVRVLISVHWEVLLQWELHSCCACKQRKKKMNRLRDFPENYQSFNISCHLYCIL